MVFAQELGGDVVGVGIGNSRYMGGVTAVCSLELVRARDSRSAEDIASSSRIMCRISDGRSSRVDIDEVVKSIDGVRLLFVR